MEGLVEKMIKLKNLLKEARAQRKPRKGDRIIHHNGKHYYWGHIYSVTHTGTVRVKYPTQHHTSQANLSIRKLKLIRYVSDSGYAIWKEV